MSLDHKKAFTLIELLVVISIISLLSSILLASFGSARSKGKDAGKQEQVWQINNAIQLYMTDHNGKAPGLQGTCDGTTVATTPSSCIATSYDDSNGKWSLLRLDIKPYLSLPPASCTTNCSSGPFYGFVYVSPSAMAYYCGQIFCPDYGSSNFGPKYQIFTNLESGQQRGTKTDGAYFYDPTGMYLNLVATRNGVQVDQSHNGTCIISLTSNPSNSGANGTGPCIYVRKVYNPVTFIVSSSGGCLQNEDGTIPTTCSRSISPVTVNSPGVTTMTISVTQ